MMANGLPPGSGFQTHVGYGRHVNEDAGWAAPAAYIATHAGRLLAVADGMGGHEGGTYASRYACLALDDYYRRLPKGCLNWRLKDFGRHLSQLIYRIDHGLRLEAHQKPEWRHMGTTLSCLVLTRTHSIIAHVGDSRIYRWRKGHLSCLTRDHTFVQEMITEGEVDPTQADKHPLRHLLTQAVGTGEPLEHVQEHIDSLKTGDRFLLCTDGLYNAISDDQIGRLLAVPGDASIVAAGLIELALANLTSDNVTVLVTEVMHIGKNYLTCKNSSFHGQIT
jgi:PPM family protein phosphatase